MTRPLQLKELAPIKKWWNDRKESEICWKVDIKSIIDRNYDLDINNPNRKDEVYEHSSSELMEMLYASFEKSHNLLTQIREAIK
jgi:type I restriction enzyme M protein